MASTTQIIPKWQYPHYETYINDNTVWTNDSATEVDDSVKLLCFFTSGKGIDNKIVKKTSLKSFTDTFGKSNPKKYGQPLMMPIAALNTGVASVYAMRVMPEDATYANSVLFAQYKASEDKFEVRFVAKSYTGGNAPKTSDELKTLVAAEEEDAEDGFKSVPVILFRAMGRGSYGQNYRWRISSNLTAEKDYKKKLYSFQILSTEDGLAVDSTYNASIVSFASANTTSSTQISDVLGEKDYGEYPVDINCDEDAIEVIYDAYVEFLTKKAEKDGEEITVPSIEEFDLFFGHEVLSSKTSHPYYEIIASEKVVKTPVTEEKQRAKTTADGYPIYKDSAEKEYYFKEAKYYAVDGDAEYQESEELTQVFETYTEETGEFTEEVVPTGFIDVDEASGIEFAGGAEGAFGDEATVESATTAAYVKAFSGELDKTVLSSIRVPADILLDAGYPMEVKRVLAKLALARNDCELYLDCGMLDSLSNDKFEDLKRVYIEEFSDRGISINPQIYTVKDIHTKRKTDVTITYLLAQDLPVHFATYGSHIPYVKSYAELHDHVKDSLRPTVDDWEHELQEELYEARFNYFESVGENRFRRATQSTAQSYNSDLLEENNMHTLFAVKRILEADASENAYNFTSAESRNTFKQAEEAKFSGWKGSRFDTISVDFDLTEWEAERSILHCYCAIQFRNLTKRTIIEIDVNKRNFLD